MDSDQEKEQKERDRKIELLRSSTDAQKELKTTPVSSVPPVKIEPVWMVKRSKTAATVLPPPSF